jgi:hypothetical protein
MLTLNLRWLRIRRYYVSMVIHNFQHEQLKGEVSTFRGQWLRRKRVLVLYKEGLLRCHGILKLFSNPAGKCRNDT